jgi:hypothetical protein
VALKDVEVDTKTDDQENMLDNVSDMNVNVKGKDFDE